MDRMNLVVGEERSVHLPSIAPGDWSAEIDGMASAVNVRKLWPAMPYPKDDDEEDEEPGAQDVVFMVRGVSPGDATIRFVPTGQGSGPPEQPRTVEVSVRG
jgi:hypothetical protein